jgi:small subunit ribosomal protein S4e
MAKMKRLLAPKYWKVPRKKLKWVVSPRPGPHKKLECIPLQTIVRDILHLAETGKEAKSIIRKGEILVDGLPRKDHAYPAGLFDVVSIPRIKENYRVIPTSYGLDLIKIDEKEANLKICRINKKTTLKGGKLQLNLNDGKNIIVQEDKYKTYDSLLIELPNIKIVEHIPLEKGCVGITVKGKNSGIIGVVEKISEGKFKVPAKILCKTGNEHVEILREHFFVVGKDKPLITVS